TAQRDNFAFQQFLSALLNEPPERIERLATPITPSRFLPQALGLKVGAPTRPVTPVKHRHCLAIAVRMPTGHQTVVSSFSLGVIPGLNPFPQIGRASCRERV